MRPLNVLRRTEGVRRAWPASDGGLTFETTDARGRLRAGRVTPQGQVHLVPYATDPDLPALGPRAQGRLVVHRLSRRAVVLSPTRAVRILRPARVDKTLEVGAAMAGLCTRAGARAAVSRPAGGGATTQPLLEGRSLHDLGAGALPAWQALAGTWPALAALADSPQALSLPRHTAWDEARVLRGWLAQVRRHRAVGPLEALENAVEAACTALVRQDAPVRTTSRTGAGSRGRPVTEVPSHRDLHDKQVLWDGRTPGLLDLDTAARAEAALDVGNLLAHLELRALAGTLDAEAARAAAGYLRDAVEHLPTTPERTEVYTRSARLRLACVYAFRPTAGPWLDAWLDHVLGT